MKPTVGDLERVADEYFSGRHAFWAFYHAFMDTWIEAELGEEDLDRWEEAYEIDMAAPDPVAPDDRDVGIIGKGSSNLGFPSFASESRGVNGRGDR